MPDTRRTRFAATRFLVQTSCRRVAGECRRSYRTHTHTHTQCALRSFPFLLPPDGIASPGDGETERRGTNRLAAGGNPGILTHFFVIHMVRTLGSLRPGLLRPSCSMTRSRQIRVPGRRHGRPLFSKTCIAARLFVTNQSSFPPPLLCSTGEAVLHTRQPFSCKYKSKLEKKEERKRATMLRTVHTLRSALLRATGEKKGGGLAGWLAGY